MVRSCLSRDNIVISPARFRGTFEEPARDRKQLRLVEQKGVVSLVRGDLGKRDAGRGGIECMNDGARFNCREQPVACERDDAEPRRRIAEAIRHDAVVIAGEIEVIHRTGQIEIRVGVEPLHERNPLMPQIGFQPESRHQKKKSGCHDPESAGRIYDAAPRPRDMSNYIFFFFFFFFFFMLFSSFSYVLLVYNQKDRNV